MKCFLGTFEVAPPLQAVVALHRVIVFSTREISTVKRSGAFWMFKLAQVRLQQNSTYSKSRSRGMHYSKVRGFQIRNSKDKSCRDHLCKQLKGFKSCRMVVRSEGVLAFVNSFKGAVLIG